ncbi:MAG: valine--pyruvate transaminase [Gammaproteobacteria bacterium]|nr:valine--pyruvate transaminase [Gammaproteobacteria bacterium]NIN62639.1 valine--pyruvate transaminase [Gammaproteobacteria bacterium]NIO63176.1 valine--pyruvate transaminase [Gammaproteobacteria bacterium]NIQ11326.1 valine--pyruvate transaminase [Gammaproteobacteria bacterium]NIQ20277.1 valine--pyruvate transaminase [Gammaproteobacteria bacterium]
MQFSRFCDRFADRTGIVQLMDDLGNAMATDSDVLMLGGGNPGHIPEVQQYIYESMQRILENPAEFFHVIGDYGSPQGDISFIHALAKFLRRELNWNIGSENIVLTAGSQAGFFYLFNMLGGEFADGQFKRILLPLTPEYIGYADVGLVDNLFISYRPEIEILDDHLFKYHVNFHDLQITPDIGAICVSRPTNPTGNVLTNAELVHLQEIADKHQIPLIIDNAYGQPFPNIVFTEATPLWTENTIICMSLSKLGLPGTRTGIIIGPEELIKAITNINAVLNLALGNFGPALVRGMISSGEISKVCDSFIRPYYQAKSEQTMRWIQREMADLDYYVHKPEGAIFLWLWFPRMKISSEELYQRLKSKGVLIISGHHFFPGLEDDWEHRHQCIRLTYSMHPAQVDKAIGIIADEVRGAS